MNSYDDIINLPRPISKRPPMPMNQRAAQFAPFSALVGYSEKIADVSKVLDSKIELTEERIAEINRKIQMIQEKLDSKPTVTITYFVSTRGKEMGFYQRNSTKVKKIDSFQQQLLLDDNTYVSFADIIDITGSCFE